MKAACIKEWGKPLEIVDLPKPEPRPGEVLVKISGVSHTDIRQWKGDWLAIRQIMEMNNVRVIGHELTI